MCITDLPGVFNLTFDTLGMSAPYITPTAERCAHWQQELAPYTGLKIGLVWAGSLATLNGRPRSCPFQHYLPLLDTPNTHFFGLQYGPYAAECHSTQCAAFTNLEAHLTDFNEAAAIIANMDLIITIDTSIAHLAGAMGRPVWTMLPYATDWRWFTDANQSPWYPTMRLFRQPAPRDWPSVIQAVKKCVHTMLAMT